VITRVSRVTTQTSKEDNKLSIVTTRRDSIVNCSVSPTVNTTNAIGVTTVTLVTNLVSLVNTIVTIVTTTISII